MDRIQAIDTFYNGIYFRSRLEARWAVFFDLIGEQYEYEPSGFKINSQYPYLPDFYLPKKELYCEIKNKSAFECEELINNGLVLRDGNEKAYRYTEISKELQKKGVFWVLFMGTPYDYIEQGQYFYFNKSHCCIQYEEELVNKVLKILNQSHYKEAEYAAKARFEHGDSPKRMFDTFKTHCGAKKPREIFLYVICRKLIWILFGAEFAETKIDGAELNRALHLIDEYRCNALRKDPALTEITDIIEKSLKHILNHENPCDKIDSFLGYIDIIEEVKKEHGEMKFHSPGELLYDFISVFNYKMESFLEPTLQELLDKIRGNGKT